MLCALAAVALALTLVPAGATRASAETLTPAAPAPSAPSDTPSGTPTPEPPTIDDLGNGLVHLPLTVSGRGAEGDHLEISGGSGSSSCRATVGADGGWDCRLTSLPDGPSVVIRAVSLDSGAAAPTRRVAVLSAPSITAPDGGLVTGGGIRGTAYPGATVTVRADNGATCTFVADSTGAWGCVLGSLGSGAYTVAASQRGPRGFPNESSASSSPVRITVDKTAPAAPTIVSPGSGSVRTGEPLTFNGTGETGASIGVYAGNDSGSSVLCTATVRAGAWNCTGSMPPGKYTVSALQTDPAGNVSAASNAVVFTFTAPAPIPSSPSSPSKTPQATPTPAVPAVPPGTTPAPSPNAPQAGRGGPGVPDWVGTPFTTASAPVVTAAAFPGWLRSIILAVAALLLLALPARLLAGTIARGRAERGERRRGSLFGRNRSAAELRESEDRLSVGAAGTDESRGPNPWSTAAALAAASALVTLSSPVGDAAAYLRVLVAITIALVAVNAVWVLLARWTAPHLAHSHARIVFRPGMLIVVAAAAVASRLFGLQPAVLFGLILGIALVEGTSRVARGQVAAVQLAGIATVGVLAWLTVGIIPEPTGVVSAFATELANSLSLLGLGTAAIALIPVGGLAGRAVFQWSRLVWLGMSLVVYTLLFALLLPVASLVETGENLIILVIATLAFAVLSVCVWMWERFVEPARQ
ncbi:hypothetical protein ACFVWR_15215 [Leifsonia sp. NPDC058292]|uniref:hypothetical protein n=1 Tax=Leifsonia sp. NPDC058292 TaxID=3346428 RepID=UPI0036DDA5BB